MAVVLDKNAFQLFAVHAPGRVNEVHLDLWVGTYGDLYARLVGLAEVVGSAGIEFELVETEWSASLSVFSEGRIYTVFVLTLI
ncbi:hypothetical protein ACFRAQ_34925 [Nocardia sp. NPDC056611]|uniref:hypothetical protein n=1 Tax=Nocardia sp. NPDC056611 TaxID=3345877 RepID=UPI00366A6A4D